MALKKRLDISRSYEINGWTFICMPFFWIKGHNQIGDLNQVVDWQNSSFYQATNQSSSVISYVSIISERGSNGIYS